MINYYEQPKIKNFISAKEAAIFTDTVVKEQIFRERQHIATEIEEAIGNGQYSIIITGADLSTQEELIRLGYKVETIIEGYSPCIRISWRIENAEDD